MDTDTRIKGLIKANNINVEKRRALSNVLRDILALLPDHMHVTKHYIKKSLHDNGPS